MFTESQAARIIELLESIDASLKRKNARADRYDQRMETTAAAGTYLEPLLANIDRLRGQRLTASQVAEIIGVKFDGTKGADRMAMAAAINQLDVLRGKSNGVRYYHFPTT